MKESYAHYIDLNYKPRKDDMICLFYVEPAKGVSMKEAAAAVAAESSTGTWTEVTTMKKRIMKMSAKVFDIKGHYVKIAYPAELFEMDNVPEILSSVAGNIFGMKEVENLRLVDNDFPKVILKRFKGPKHGIQGVRKIMRVKKRPLLGTIVKPKLGLHASEHAQVAYNAWIGGCDIVKDDENLTSQKFNPFEERVIKTLEARDKAEEETGERKAYMANVTAETIEMLERVDFVRSQGGKYVMVDIITTGWSALQTLRENSGRLIIHAHRAMHAALTRNKKHGISMLAIADFARLIGVDQIHIGTIFGKMHGSKKEVTTIDREIREMIIKPGEHKLAEKWENIKPVFPVASGGLHPGHVPKLVKTLGTDIIIQMGGGIHGHPDGTTEGAVAARQALEATMQGISLKKYAVDHRELRRALEKWVYKK